MIDREILNSLLNRLKKYLGKVSDTAVMDIPLENLPPFLKDDIKPLIRDTYYYLSGVKESVNLDK